VSELAPDDTAGAPAWFGKLACLGDFASRRLAPEPLHLCDTWLSRGVEASRAQLGERWLDIYLTGPLWRFAWAPGVVDAQWWFGVLMPSVDNVGRYFPLLVALPQSHAPDNDAGLGELEQWFAELAQAALATLEPTATLQRFEDELHAARRLSVRPSVAPPEETHWTDRTAYTFAGEPTLARALQELASDDAAKRYRGRTLWRSLGARSGDNRITIANGLPAAESFADLLQGAW
jgi:type VI secretion system protein ImpM